MVSRFEAIEVADNVRRPEVALFGDSYSRDNQVLNQDLVQFIEAHGGEVITTPYTSYVKMVLRPYYWKWFLEGQVHERVVHRGPHDGVPPPGEENSASSSAFWESRSRAYDASPQAILAEYNVRVEHTGEAMDNLLKVFYITRAPPQRRPFRAGQPGLLLSIPDHRGHGPGDRGKDGIPVVSVTYDGTGGAKNEVILPYLSIPEDVEAGPGAFIRCEGRGASGGAWWKVLPGLGWSPQG